jgi:hypothetical protein
VLVDEAAVAGVELDAVADQLRADDVLLLADHVLGAGQQVGGGDVFLDSVTRTVELALRDAGQVDHRFAQCLRWDRAGVHAHAAEHSAVFDDRHRFAEFGCGDSGLLPAGTRADDDEVVLPHGWVHVYLL